MQKIVLIPIVLLILFIYGCSGRSMYDTLRTYQEMRCNELQGHDREECLRQSGLTYDEYQKQLRSEGRDR